MLSILFYYRFYEPLSQTVSEIVSVCGGSLEPEESFEPASPSLVSFTLLFLVLWASAGFFCPELLRFRCCWGLCCDGEVTLRKVSRWFLVCCVDPGIGSRDRTTTIIGISRLTFNVSRSGDFGSQNSSTTRYEIRVVWWIFLNLKNIKICITLQVIRWTCKDVSISGSRYQAEVLAYLSTERILKI